MGLFGGGSSGEGDLLKQADEAIAGFEKEIAHLNAEKDSLMRRQVEIWSVSSSESNQGMETEYKDAAQGVALNVKKVLCLEEHIKKVRLALFHAKNGDDKGLKDVLSIEDPCVNVTAEVPNVIYRPAPSPVDLGGQQTPAPTATPTPAAS
jgi:hypothetical protein